ncbi:MAG TPA: hypothetical protein VIL74_04465 [Pyrinomonadaceae bacterium]|jgi:hypothetical protein
MVGETERNEIAGSEFSRPGGLVVLVLCLAVTVFSLTFFDDARQARATMIAGICLIL